MTTVNDGEDGNNGVDGYNTCVVPLYRRSATPLTNSDRPNGTLTYSFATNNLTGTGFNEWSQTMPAVSSGTKLYVTMATARSKDLYDEISANEWSTPVEYVADGMNSATVLIYKRSATQPNNSDRPANGVVYTFADGSLSGTLNGWSKTIPATDGNPLWVRQATAVSNTTTDTINSSEWSGDSSGNAVKMIEDGVNSAVVPLYRRSATALTDSDRPTDKLTYTFSTGALSGSGFNSWSQTIPAAEAGTKLYVIMATARSTTDTDEISANEWSTPVEYVADGMNSAPVVIYKRDDGIGSNDKPSNGCTYTFSTGALSGTLNGWSTQIPNSNGKPCWVRHATAVSNTNTDTINASEWSSATKLVENGDKGDDAQYIYLKGSAFNKDSAGTNVVNSEIRVNGGNNLATQSRGLCLVTLNRQTLAVVDSAVVYDTYDGSTGISNLITKLNSLGDNVFVCLVSYDAIGWNNSLIYKLQTFGMGEIPYTGSNRYPFLFIGYKNLGKGNGITRMNNMAEPAVPVELGVYVANGALSVKDGEVAITYQISLAGSTFYRDPNTDTIYVNIKGKVTKTFGSTTSAYTELSRSELSMYFLDINSSGIESQDNVPDVNSISEGFIVSGNTFATKYYNGTGFSDESAFVVNLTIGGKVVASESIQITTNGKNGSSIKGDPGRMYYIAGEFPAKAPYSRTTTLCPVVYYGTEWWYLNADSATSSDIPSDSTSSKWRKIENFGMVLTEAIFVKNFARFGSAIISGDWLLSVHGYIDGTYYGGTVESPDEYDGRAAYTYFDPAYPWGYDPFNLTVIAPDVDKAYTTAWTKITDNFRLTAGTYTFKITAYVNASDTVHVRLFNGDNTQDEYYIAGTTSEEAVVLTKTITLGSTSNNWNLRAATNEDGEEGHIVSVEIEPADARFIPNYAVDLRTGQTYQSDAHIRGAIMSLGSNSKIIIDNGIISFYGAFSFPNIVMGVNSDGLAILNYYDKDGKFLYNLGPEGIKYTQSQAESMTLKFYNVDAGSEDCTSLTDSEIVMLYLYMFKNQLTNDLVNGSLYKYLAKIVAGAYFEGSYCASIADAQKYNEKIIKTGYSASTKLRDSDVYSGGGIVVTTGRTTSGIITKLSNMLNGETVDELDYRGYNVMQDSDFNRSKDGTTYSYYTKNAYNPVRAFYWDSSYPSTSVGGIGYENGYGNVWYLNLCTNPADDDTLIDPIYYFNLQCIDSNGTNKGFKTLYINRKKLSAILQAAGKSL
jgi:hypothetical protein